mmetsp:Transcript_13850/g.36803  ORF Transcript_13850/g.36803 Transcript_13850/m.36803 type:complete len:124 (-) Transcript_13850:108-479(-)
MGEMDAASMEGRQGIAGFLERFASDATPMDEGLTQAIRGMLQLGSVLAGGRLSDTEIRALPKVRFEDADEQSCPICLECYQRGELLTALRCDHFFHVDCLARWLHHSTQCPLCRTHADPTDEE